MSSASSAQGSLAYPTRLLRLVDRMSASMDRAGALLNRYGRPVRDALVLVGLARAAYYFIVQDIQPWNVIGVDARAYWQIDLAHPYAASVAGAHSAYLYSPVFAQVMAPLSILPFPVFFAGWTLLLLATFIWLVRPWPWAALILLLPISYELSVGNIHFLMAAVIVLGFRVPAIWALPVLTKITPAVGLLWFVVRREWRSLAIAVGTIGVIVLISFIVSASAWIDWIRFLLASSGGSEYPVLRLAMGATLVVIGAATGRRWLVPLAVLLALPVPYVNSWVILLAVIRLRDRVPTISELERDRAGTSPMIAAETDR
jgi:hypothetical protein